MKKTIIATAIILVSAAVLMESGVFNALVMFVLMGQIPGTTYSVPASVMLTLLGGIAIFLAIRFIATKTQHIVTLNRLVKKHLAHKARMPRRRFGQI